MFEFLARDFPKTSYTEHIWRWTLSSLPSYILLMYIILCSFTVYIIHHDIVLHCCTHRSHSGNKFVFTTAIQHFTTWNICEFTYYYWKSGISLCLSCSWLRFVMLSSLLLRVVVQRCSSTIVQSYILCMALQYVLLICTVCMCIWSDVQRISPLLYIMIVFLVSELVFIIACFTAKY